MDHCYTEIVENIPSSKLPDSDEFAGCDCSESDCSDENCLCIRYSLGPSYDAEGRLTSISSSVAKPILECHGNCGCVADRCHNRVVGNNRKFAENLTVVHTESKGYGVVTCTDIAKGAFVCEYLGELVDYEEANKRLAMISIKSIPTYLLVLREHFSNEDTRVVAIDAGHFGNLSRFINHSCEPNLEAHIFRRGSDRPCIGLFALRDITAGEELSYHYGDGASSLSKTACHCKSEHCKGYLPLSVV